MCWHLQTDKYLASHANATTYNHYSPTHRQMEHKPLKVTQTAFCILSVAKAKVRFQEVLRAHTVAFYIVLQQQKTICSYNVENMLVSCRVSPLLLSPASRRSTRAVPWPVTHFREEQPLQGNANRGEKCTGMFLSAKNFTCWEENLLE